MYGLGSALTAADTRRRSDLPFIFYTLLLRPAGDEKWRAQSAALSGVILAGRNRKRDESCAGGNATFRPAGNVNSWDALTESMHITRRVAIFTLKSRAENNNRNGSIGVTSRPPGKQKQTMETRSSQASEDEIASVYEEGLIYCRASCDF